MKSVEKIRARIAEITRLLESGAPLSPATYDALVAERYALRWVVAE